MPRCKSCGNKFEQYSFNNKFCKDLDCQVARGLFLLEKAKKRDLNQREELKKEQARVTTRKRKKDLQDEINKLSRFIDYRFKFLCIDTDKPIIGSGNAAHYKNVGGHENIRYNLHNIHLSTVYSNKYNPEHKKGYKSGLIKRYGVDYEEYLENGLNLTYPTMHFTSEEIKQALKITRSILRTFDTYDLTNPIIARDQFNSIIGLYKIPYL